MRPIAGHAAGHKCCPGQPARFAQPGQRGLWVDFSFLDAVDFDQFSGVSIPGLMETKVNSATEFSAAVRDEKDIPEVIAAFVPNQGAESARKPREISLEKIYLQLQNGGGLS